MREMIEKMKCIAREVGATRLAKVSGLRRYTVQRFISGGNVTVETLLAIYESLEKLGYSFKREVIEYEPVVLDDEPVEVVVKPVYSYIGAGNEVVVDDIIDKVPVPLEFGKPKFLFCKVRGNSMEPLISDGGIIGIDSENKIVEDGKVYALTLNGGNLVKKVYKHGKNLVLESVNPNYPPLVKRADEIWIVGRVALVINKLH